MDDIWYIARAGQPYGPISDGEFGKLIELDHLQEDDLVWRQGWPDWVAGAVVIEQLRADELGLEAASAPSAGAANETRNTPPSAASVATTSAAIDPVPAPQGKLEETKPLSPAPAAASASRPPTSAPPR